MSLSSDHRGDTPWSDDSVRAIAEELKQLDGPLLPILHAINERLGYVDERAVPVVADVLNLTRAEVHGVVSFYHDFRRAAPRRHALRICRAEACQSLGADALYVEVERACASDDAVSIEPVYCLGNCALSPAAFVDGKLHGRLDRTKILALLGKR